MTGEVSSTEGHGGRLTRNEIVELFGTPDETEGSVNDPRIRVEHGVEYNEKWTYFRPRGEATDPAARVIHWQRYDFQGSTRIERDGHRVRESEAELLARVRALSAPPLH
jgi:hypothetical protein